MQYTVRDSRSEVDQGDPRGRIRTGSWIPVLVPGYPYWFLDTGYWILVTGAWLLASGYWSLVTGLWLLASGYWILDTGYWILDTGIPSTAAREHEERC